MNNKSIVFLLCVSGLLISCNEVEYAPSAYYSLLDIANVAVSNRDSSSANPQKKVDFSSNATEHLGMDISHYQGDILKEIDPSDSMRFLICKATQGDNYVDPDFRTNWNGIAELGLIRGVYHFYVCADDPLTQANHFVNNISDISSTDIAPILDIEQGSMSPNVSSEKMIAEILVFLNTVESKLKRRPILYTDYAFAQQYLTQPAFAKYDLWLAEYSGAEQPKVPTVWQQRGFKIWQRSDGYNIDHRKADLDIFYGELRQIVR
jgi:GH25 family lysozyme M1 (1,4-beta-N-acetylmuramidase)